jgi:hypothetical protein
MDHLVFTTTTVKRFINFLTLYTLYYQTEADAPFDRKKNSSKHQLCIVTLLIVLSKRAIVLF